MIRYGTFNPWSVYQSATAAAKSCVSGKVHACMASSYGFFTFSHSHPWASRYARSLGLVTRYRCPSVLSLNFSTPFSCPWLSACVLCSKNGTYKGSFPFFSFCRHRYTCLTDCFLFRALRAHFLEIRVMSHSKRVQGTVGRRAQTHLHDLPSDTIKAFRPNSFNRRHTVTMLSFSICSMSIGTFTNFFTPL